jgi:hypothetical protein
MAMLYMKSYIIWTYLLDSYTDDFSNTILYSIFSKYFFQVLLAYLYLRCVAYSDVTYLLFATNTFLNVLLYFSFYVRTVHFNVL